MNKRIREEITINNFATKRIRFILRSLIPLVALFILYPPSRLFAYYQI